MIFFGISVVVAVGLSLGIMTERPTKVDNLEHARLSASRGYNKICFSNYFTCEDVSVQRLLRQMWLFPTQQSGHLYLSGRWLGVDLRTDIKKTCVQNKLDMCSDYAHHSRFNNQHDWGNLYDHLMNMRIVTLTMNKIYISSSKIMRQWLIKRTIWKC